MNSGSNKQFLRNVLTLTAGTSVAQAIPVALSPLLTRLYGPDDFGVYALYTTLALLVSMAATGRYDLAVVIPEEDADANALVWLSVAIAAVLSILLFLLVLPYSAEMARLLGEPRIRPWLLLMPVSVLLISVYSTLNYWLNRQRQYARMGRNRIVQTASTGISQLGLGYAGFGAAGLIWGNVAGYVLTSGLLARTFLGRHRQSAGLGWNFVRIRALAGRFRNHPLHILPAQWASMAALQIPIIVIAKLAGSSVVGLYSVALYLISIPTNLIATAIGDVYRERASVAFRERGEFRSLYLTTIWFAFRVSILPLLALYALAPEVFAFALGEAWRPAGPFARLLAISALFQFVFTSVDKGAVIVGATRYIAGWCFVRLGAFMTIGILATIQRWQVETFIVYTVIINSALYAFDAAYQYYLSGARAHRAAAS